MSSPTNVRFPGDVGKGLAHYAHQRGAKKSQVVVTAVREWLRMQEHPGIVFVTTVTGERRAALAVGPQVWTVAESWLQHEKPERSPLELAHVLGLSLTDVETALGYWAEYRDEVDAVIEREHLGQDESMSAWERRRELDDA